MTLLLIKAVMSLLVVSFALYVVIHIKHRNARELVAINSVISCVEDDHFNAQIEGGASAEEEARETLARLKNRQQELEG